MIKKIISRIKRGWESFIKSQFIKIKRKEKETHYNTKYPTTNILYRRTDKLGEKNIDVRLFCNPRNFQLPKFPSNKDDETAITCLDWIIENITYKSDSNTYKRKEYWAFGYETFDAKVGDCEDGAILLYDILRANGIPAWKVRLTAGEAINPKTKEVGGHAYVTYYSEEHDKWVDLDWCYLPTTDAIKDRPDYKDNPIYGKVWFSFNEKYAWSKGLNEEANELINQ